MKYIKCRLSASMEEFTSFLADNESVNKNVNIEDKRGIPYIHVKNKNDKIKLTCEFKGGSTRDNAFIGGTSFIGKIRVKDGKTELHGIISTAPIFHLVLFSMLAFSLIMCIVNMAFNAVPLCLVAFDLVMYKDEFRKQGIIEKYIFRAAKRLEAKTKKD
jgi:hypothetical protein